MLAGEKLPIWLTDLPSEVRETILRGVRLFHAYSPFTVLRDVLRDPPELIMERFAKLEVFALAALGLLAWRAAYRLHGHFRERHYLPVRDVSGERRAEIGDYPLSWWAVKRVSEYSGQVNVWLAGGFAILYSAFTLAGANWPAALGREVFLTFNAVGGMPAFATALVVMSAVPAAFQYGLWDSSALDRCRKLELLLLTDLEARDYWQAAAAAAWTRGRGYFAVAVLLWVTLICAKKRIGARSLWRWPVRLSCGRFILPLDFGPSRSACRSRGWAWRLRLYYR